MRDRVLKSVQWKLLQCLSALECMLIQWNVSVSSVTLSENWWGLCLHNLKLCASSYCNPLVVAWLVWSRGHLVVMATSSLGLHWWLLLWTSAGGLSGMLGIGSTVLMVTPPLVIRVSLAVEGLLVTPSLVIRVSLVLGLLVSDSSCVCGESALTSADASASDPISLLSLESGRGMDRRLKVLTWHIPCRWLKAVLLYVMGSLGHSVYEVVDVAEHVLSRLHCWVMLWGRASSYSILWCDSWGQCWWRCWQYSEFLRGDISIGGGDLWCTDVKEGLWQMGLH